MTTLLHMSDPHFGSHDSVIMKQVLGQARELHPSLTVVTGDFTMQGRRSEFRLAQEFIRGLPEPRLVLPGNHDVPAGNHLWQRFLSPYDRYREAIASDIEPGYSNDAIELVSLNTNRAWGFYLDWSEGRTNPLQRARLEEHFANFDRRPPLRVLAMHHPVICPPDHPRALVKPLAPLQKSIAHARVDLILGGHFHQSYCLTMDSDFGWSSVISQVSTACSVRTQNEPQGFHLLELQPARITCARYYWDQSCFRLRDRIATRLADKGWTLDLHPRDAPPSDT